MSFSSSVKEEIEKQKVWNNKSNLDQEEQIARVHIRENFLQHGSVSEPEKKYHLEIVLNNKKSAEDLLEILRKYKLNFNIIERRKKQVLYIKNGEDISKFLAFIGANSSVLRFEEVRVMKEMRNNVNRKVNCETANLEKTVNAAIKQVEAIKYLQKINKFDDLEEGVKQIAILRVENPDSSIENLGTMLDKKISKSGANHRLKKIIEIADEERKKANIK